MTTKTTLQCKDCESKLPRGCFGLTKPKAVPCRSCGVTICSKCAGDQALIPFKQNEPPLPVKKSSMQSYCKSCFKQVSVLDYDKSYDVIEPKDPPTSDNNSSNDVVTLLWVHGGGASRALFRPHANFMATKGYRSILMDLPGHGTLVNTPLTLDACVKATQQILHQECSSSNNNSEKVIYIGGSLGAYIGFHILQHLHRQYFTAAILLDCGQNVGPDCSLKARLGIWFLRKLTIKMNNKQLMGAMMSSVQKGGADYHLVECCYGGGMFFQQGMAQCDCMHAVAPGEIIPQLDENFPMLFFNGSGDYRDSEDRWLNLCKDVERSDLKVYEGGDHFFCHDSRFVSDMLQRMDDFIQKAVV